MPLKPSEGSLKVFLTKHSLENLLTNVDKWNCHSPANLLTKVGQWGCL